MVLEQTGHFRIRNSDPGTTLRAVAMLAERMNKNVALEVRDSGTLILGAGRARRSSSCSLILGGGGSSLSRRNSIGLSDVFKASRAANLNELGATVGE